MQLLKTLLADPFRLEEISSLLSEFDWDSEELVKLTTEHLMNLLESYTNGRLRSSEIENWANAVEGREDIHYEDFSIIITELANPLLFGEISKNRAKKILEELKGDESESM